MEPDGCAASATSAAGTRVPFFFKQWGGYNKKKAGRLLDGRVWDEWPGDAMASADRPVPSASGRATP